MINNKKEINIDIGRRLQEIRERRGLTQEQFAELLDVGVQHISKIERGVTGMSLSSLKRACEIFEISADYLLFGTGGMQENALVARMRKLPSEQAGLVEDGMLYILEALEQTNTGK